MSQSSIAEQVKDLGIPVRRGTRITATVDDHPNTPDRIGSDLWLSRWARNAFQNYPIVSRAMGVRWLADCAKGMPAFVVGVGPSLDSAIAHLKTIGRRALIISTDAALRSLLANRIMPDAVISYDAKEKQNVLWSSLPDGMAWPPLLISTCTHPESIRSWRGPVLFYNQFHTQDDLCGKILPVVYPHIGQIPSAGTVGNMAVLAAHLMGCDPICCVGMDFCYQPAKGGVMAWRYRAQDYRWQSETGAGTPPAWIQTEIKELYDNDERMARSFMVKDENGKEFRSDPELGFYLQSFKDVMTHYKVPVVNCTPEGMIPDTFFKMSLEDAIQKYCRIDFQDGRTILYQLNNLARPHS